MSTATATSRLLLPLLLPATTGRASLGTSPSAPPPRLLGAAAAAAGRCHRRAITFTRLAVDALARASRGHPADLEFSTMTFSAEPRRLR